MSYIFDIDNKLIQLTSIATLDMQDLYSRWKDEVLGILPGAEQAFRVIKEPLGGNSFLGPYYFVMNDWQIRPSNTAHELIVAGTVLQDSSSALSPFKLDDLSFSVSIVRQVAVEVQVIETGVSGLSASESAQLAQIADVKSKTDNLPDNTKSDLSIVNQGVQKASKFIPHSTDL